MNKKIVIGVDVSKDELVVAWSDPSVQSKPVQNRMASINRWLKTLPATAALAMESTGSYHVPLFELAHRRGLTVYIVNPRDMRNYAKSLGVRGKTDQSDAEILARYVERESERLHPAILPTPAQKAVGSLLSGRTTASKARMMLRATGKTLPKATQKLMRDAVAAIDKLIDGIDHNMEQESSSEPDNHERMLRLRTVTGVGPVVSLGMSSILGRIPFKSSDSFVAYLGLDPRPHDSGMKRGRRRLTKRGPGWARRLLYISAMSAVRTESWKPVYERLRKKGLPSTSALVVIARKIARVIFSLWRYGGVYDPAKLNFRLT